MVILIKFHVVYEDARYRIIQKEDMVFFYITTKIKAGNRNGNKRIKRG